MSDDLPQKFKPGCDCKDSLIRFSSPDEPGVCVRCERPWLVIDDPDPSLTPAPKKEQSLRIVEGSDPRLEKRIAALERWRAGIEIREEE